MKSEIEPRLMRLNHAAAYLGIGVKALRAMCRNGRLPIVRGVSENSPWLLDRQDLDRIPQEVTKEQAEPDQPRRARGVVYLIAGAGLVKVGKATDVRSRIGNLQTGSPVPLSLIASYSFPDTGQVELAVHRALCRKESCHVYREWFSLSDADIAAICDVLAAAQKDGCMSVYGDLLNKLGISNA